MKYQAELRVFEPLSALPESLQGAALEAKKWTRDEVELASAQRAEQRLKNSPQRPFPPESQPELFRILRFPTETGSEFFCPEDMDIRSMLAAQELEATISADLLELVMPEQMRADHEHQVRINDMRVRSGVPLDRPHTHTSVWQVPLAWFMLCGDDDTVETGRNELLGGQFYARRRFPAMLGIERGGQAAATLTRLTPRWEIIDDIVEMVAWLQKFHPDSIVELDYGDLARYVWPDQSVEDVTEGLAAAREGEALVAALRYRLYAQRWARVTERSRAN